MYPNIIYDTTVVEFLFVTVGTIGYSLKSSAECPSVAMSNEITWLVVPASQPQISSIHCANVRDCGGFNYNMQTGT